MKRVISLCFLVAVLLLPCFSQETSTGQTGVSIQYTSSFVFNHLSVDAFSLFNLGQVGIGFGLKGYVGLDYEAIFLGTYARVELGWFYLGIGPLFILEQPEDPTFMIIDKGISVLCFSGAALPVLEHEHGKLVVIANLEASITPFPIVSPDTGDLFLDIFIGVFGTMINQMFSTIKFNIGLGYYGYF